MSNTCENEAVECLGYTKKLLNGDIESQFKEDESKEHNEEKQTNRQNTISSNNTPLSAEENVLSVCKNTALGGYGFSSVSFNQ